jgi:hypothetical protein
VSCTTGVNLSTGAVITIGGPSTAGLVEFGGGTVSNNHYITWNFSFYGA